MSGQIDYQQVCQMLLAAVEKVRQNHEMLSRLDAAVGDGDHGTTMLRTMEAVAKTISESAGSDLKELLARVGWKVMGCDGGSTSALLGCFFMGMSEAVAGRTELDQPAMVAMFEGGILTLQKQSRARVGDKTMMDAFLPALEAMKADASGKDLRATLLRAAAASTQGAEATKSWPAKFGRARNLGARAIGHADPGAVSVSLLFQGFSEAVQGFAPTP
ncbi:MAG: dihydroxyacetone kinase subunit DhaL [Verrucomicrobia bacterium]|nr:dihydroxyacetone kinase subunit DhaL [Verrucomicrobiota bacterium]